MGGESGPKMELRFVSKAGLAKRRVSQLGRIESRIGGLKVRFAWIERRSSAREGSQGYRRAPWMEIKIL